MNDTLDNMTYLGVDSEKLSLFRALDTAREIDQQPELWKNVYRQVYDRSHQIQEFLTNAFDQIDDIFLVGAGTSAFIGQSLNGVFQKITGKNTRAVSTTNIVSHPNHYLSKNRSVLMISFARSGNSPESLGAIKLADSMSKSAYHLVISCNENGEMVQGLVNNKVLVFILPEAANDKSLAMTSSYSSMLLAGLLMSSMDRLKQLKCQVDLLSECGRSLLDNQLDVIRNCATIGFERAVFLGSGSLNGTAAEGHLKLQELTNGKIICVHDSFLGFRHGPKAVVNKFTLVVYLMSNNPHVQKYETDLVKVMTKENYMMAELGISEKQNKSLNLKTNIVLNPTDQKLEEEFLAILSILPAQLLGFFKSWDLGLSPDNPSLNGAISRVVQGVTIYDYIPENSY